MRIVAEWSNYDQELKKIYNNFLEEKERATTDSYQQTDRKHPGETNLNIKYTQVIHVLSVCVFPGNWTHNLCATNAMLYHWATGIQRHCTQRRNRAKCWVAFYNYLFNLSLFLLFLSVRWWQARRALSWCSATEEQGTLFKESSFLHPF